MRALPLNGTLLVLAAMLVWSLVRTMRPDSGKTWTLAGRYVSHPVVLAILLLGVCANLGFSILTGYINPRDNLQDIIAAEQFLKHQTMYPADMAQRGVGELATPIRGEALLRRTPVIRNELNTLGQPPLFSANAHPPMLGAALSIPVRLFGFRGTYVFEVLLSIALLYLAATAILHELFPGLDSALFCASMAMIFGWYQVGTTLRSGQPSIILFALIALSWLMLRRNRPVLAGAAAGLAACLHAFPALLTLYFLIRARKAFLSAAGVIAAFSLVTAAFSVPHTFSQWMQTDEYVAGIFVPRLGNVSFAGVFTNLLSGLGLPPHVNVVAPAMVLIVAGALVVYLRPWSSAMRTFTNIGPDRFDREYSVWIAGMLLASPISWIRYFPIMLLPIAILVRAWSKDPPVWAASALFAALIPMSLPDATFGLIHDGITRSAGVLAGWVWGATPTLSLVAILCWIMRDNR
jgi:hypothetical protein